MKGAVLVVTLILLFSACTSGPRFFPVGLYDVPPSDYAAVASAGFNTVVGSVSVPSLNIAATNKLKVIGHPPGVSTLRSMNGHSALWAWYLSDEPDMHLASPAQIEDRRSAVRRVSKKPAFITLMSGAATEKYRGTADLVAVDWYPVPWAPVATVAREMRLARLGMRDRPFYAILQAFDWASMPELLRTDVPLRPPSAAELRCMAYLALMQGASGILFYTYDNQRWKLREHPEIWWPLTDLAKEIRQQAPIFCERVEWWPIQTETHGPPAAMYNEIMEARILLSLFHVRRSSRSVRSGYYLLAANTSAEPVEFSVKLPFADVHVDQLDLPTETVLTEERFLRKTYKPFEVSLFGPIKGRIAR